MITPKNMPRPPPASSCTSGPPASFCQGLQGEQLALRPAVASSCLHLSCPPAPGMQWPLPPPYLMAASPHPPWRALSPSWRTPHFTHTHTLTGGGGLFHQGQALPSMPPPLHQWQPSHLLPLTEASPLGGLSPQRRPLPPLRPLSPRRPLPSQQPLSTWRPPPTPPLNLPRFRPRFRPPS